MPSAPSAPPPLGQREEAARRSKLKWSSWSQTVPSPMKFRYLCPSYCWRLQFFCLFLPFFFRTIGGSCRLAITPIVGGTIRFPIDQCLRLTARGEQNLLLSPLIAHYQSPRCRAAAGGKHQFGSIRFESEPSLSPRLLFLPFGSLRRGRTISGTSLMLCGMLISLLFACSRPRQEQGTLAPARLLLRTRRSSY